MDTSGIVDPKRQLGMRLVVIARRWRQALDTGLSSQGLSDAAWAPLFHLHRLGDGVSQKALAAAAGLDGSSLVRLLDLLVEQDLVERRAHPGDRRIKQLFLTRTGHRTVTSIRKRLATLEDELLADLDADTAGLLLQAFDRIEARIAAIS